MSENIEMLPSGKLGTRTKERPIFIGQLIKNKLRFYRYHGSPPNKKYVEKAQKIILLRGYGVSKTFSGFDFNEKYTWKQFCSDMNWNIIEVDFEKYLFRR